MRRLYCRATSKTANKIMAPFMNNVGYLGQPSLKLAQTL